MKNKILLIVVLFAFHYSVCAQKNYGFYGKTNFVEVTSVSYLPVIKNFSNSYSSEGYKKSGNSLVAASSDWFNTGFRASVGRAFKKNFAASFEYGVDFWSNPLSMQYYYNLGGFNQYIQFNRHENISMRTTHFMPKIHLASKSALLPLGLNHEIGLGLTLSKVKEKEYLYTLNSGSVDPGSSSEYIDFERVYRGIQLMYGLRMRKPLSKSLLLNYGLRYTVDFALASDSPNTNSMKYYTLSNDEIHEITKNNNFRNILSFDLGLTFAF